MPTQWSPEPWGYLDHIIHLGASPGEEIIALVQGRTPEEADANGRLMAAAPEAARLLAALYREAPFGLRGQMHGWFLKVGVALEDLETNAPPQGAPT
jgi:hypothetical protein